jgi:Domain of unknown function (DUF4402)
MGGLKHWALLLAAIAATAAAFAPAGAQCRLCNIPATDRPPDSADGDVQLQVETNLNFDRLVLSGTGMGAATVRPDGANSAEGSVLEISPRAMVGTVLVHGEANRPVRVDLPRRIELFSLAGGRITLDDVVTDLPAAPRLDASGNLTIRFGGRLLVTGDTDGQYRGDLPIAVEYQ